MNNEPVAWMQTWENQDGELKHTVNIEQIGKNDIPLYTHPAYITDEDVKYNVTVKWDDKTTHHKNVSDGTPLHYNETKTLTDEEINEIAENTLPNQAIGFVPSWQWIEFARAILRKRVRND